MYQYNINLVNLPVEILHCIFHKLDNLDVLYAFIGINNQRLESIVQNEIFSSTLDMTTISDNTTMLNRFSTSILPQICCNIKCLTIDSLSIERIFVNHYPNLIELKFSNFQRDNSLHHLTDGSSIHEILKTQITKLELRNIDNQHMIGSREEANIYTQMVYEHILNSFSKLEHFSVILTTIFPYPTLSICRLPSNSFSSMVLTHLSINVLTFTDCLCLLDGRLKQLSTLDVEIYSMDTDLSLVRNFNDLPNMKCFSFIYYSYIQEDDSQVKALVRRMLYLNKLTLYLRIRCENQLVDSLSILDEYSMHLKQLHSFDYYISIDSENMNIATKQVPNIVCSSLTLITYHFFTIPFKFQGLMCIGNIFPNIIFNNVIDLWVRDVIPFEHEFFLRLTYSFPVLKRLCISGQNKSTDHRIQSNSIAQYSHLSCLRVISIGTRYVEQFLNEGKTNLPCLTQLRVIYEELRTVTNDFTREDTRRNCRNIKQLIMYTNIVGSKDFHSYFPLLNT